MAADANGGIGQLLAFSDRGEKDGEVFVLLHGFGGSRSSWSAVLDNLSVSCRTISVDLPGHGQSPHFAERGYAKAAADQVVELLDFLGLEKVHLCGFSLGGAVACLVALTKPNRLNSLTLVAPGGFGSEIASEKLEALADANDQRAISAALTAMAAPGVAVPDGEAREVLLARADAGAGARLKEIADVISHDGKQGVLPLGKLADPPFPASVLWGTQDPVLPFRQSANLPSGFRLVTVPGAGHMLPVEAPQMIAQLLESAASAKQKPVTNAPDA